MSEITRAANAPAPYAESPHDAGSRGRAPAVVIWIRRVVPNLLVLAGLAAFAYWGHETGWKLPKFSELAGAAPEKEAKWCDEHNVPEASCVECNPAQFPRPKSFGWCAEHGVMDCPLHHPEVAQLPSPPAVTPADLQRARRALEFADRPENNPDDKTHLRRVQFASAEAFEKTGVDVRPVGREYMAESVPANGAVVYDQSRIARLSARAPGAVWWVNKQVGDPVRQGEVLALVDAADVGKAKAAYLQSLVQVATKERSYQSVQAQAKVVPEAFPELTLREAESQVREARTRLFADQQALGNLGMPVQIEDFKALAPDEAVRRIQFLGLPEAVVKSLDPHTLTTNLLPVTSPLNGVVVERAAVTGEAADSAKVLFVVADVSRMWATLDLRVEDARLVAVGQKAFFRPDGRGAKQDLVGSVAWVSTGVDEKTRTVKVRVELPNPRGELRDNTFGTGRVVLREEKDALVVPTAAIHQVGDCNVVFVRDKDFFKKGAPKLFYVREVRPGARSEDGRLTEVVVGLLPGEVVATTGSDVLRAQLMKDQLGGDDD